MKGCFDLMSTKKFIIAALCLSMAASLAACSKSDSSSNNESRVDKEIKVYVDDGGPYYIDEDGNIMRFITENNDVINESDNEGDGDSADPIYGTYDEGGIKYTLADGWYTDNSYGIPMIYSDNTESANESLVIAPATMFVDRDFASITKDSVKEIFDNYVEDGSCVSYELHEIEDLKDANGMNVKAYKLVVETQDYTVDYEETEDSDENSSEAEIPTTKYYNEYIFVDAYEPYAVVVNADNTKESIANVSAARDSVLKTLEITEVEIPDPEGEQVGDEEENIVLETEETKTTEDSE